MSWVAAAIIGGSVLGAAASSSAANTQADAATNAAQLQQQQAQQTRSDNAPWRQTGSNALAQLASGFGVAPENNAANFDSAAYLKANPDVAADPYWSQHALDHYQQHGQGEGRQFAGMPQSQTGIQPGQFTHQFDTTDLKNGLAPNYDFQLQQGLGATTNFANSTGGLVGGNTLKAVNDYAQNFAGSAYQQAFNNYNSQQTNIFNRLSNIAGLGQTANQTTATAGTQGAANAGSYLTSAGAAQAAGMVGGANAINNGIGSYLGWNYLNGGGGGNGAGVITGGSGFHP